VYATYYGAIEATEQRGLRSPALNWQVPQTFVIGVSRRRRILVWGSILGPGFITRNAYAGFGQLVLVVAALGNAPYGLALAAGIGAAHGGGRAIAVVRDAQQADATNYLETTIKKMRWRMFDGFALLAIAGATVIAIAHAV
jgi:hypothetical protein